MRLLALCLSLSALSLLAPAAGHAEAPPLAAAPTVLSISSHGQDAELGLSDLWITRMTETRLRRQGIEKWGVPLLLGLAAGGGALTALLPGMSTEGRIVAGSSAVIAAAAMFPPMFAKPENRARWFAWGGGAFAMVFGAAGFVDTLVKRNDSCTGWCYNENWVGWAGGAFFAQGATLLTLGWVERGPSVNEMKAYHLLPPHERPAAARRMLARIDRAERKAMIVQFTINMIGLGLFGAGAIVQKDRTDRAILSGFAGFSIGTETITDIMRLFGKTRTERLALGEAPDETERVFW